MSSRSYSPRKRNFSSSSRSLSPENSSRSKRVTKRRKNSDAKMENRKSNSPSPFESWQKDSPFYASNSNRSPKPSPARSPTQSPKRSFSPRNGDYRRHKRSDDYRSNDYYGSGRRSGNYRGSSRGFSNGFRSHNRGPRGRGHDFREGNSYNDKFSNSYSGHQNGRRDNGKFSNTHKNFEFSNSPYNDRSNSPRKNMYKSNTSYGRRSDSPYGENDAFPNSNRNYGRRSNSPCSRDSDYNDKMNKMSKGKNNNDSAKNSAEKKRILISYKEFLLKQRDDITPEEAQKLYNQYKEEYQMSNKKIFFERHKEEEWFCEKYSPKMRFAILQKQINFSVEASKRFFEEIKLCLKNEKELENFIEKYQLKRDFKSFEFISNLEKKLDIENETEKVREIENKLYEERQNEGKFSDSDSETPDSKELKQKPTDSKKEDQKDFSLSADFGKNLSSFGQNYALRTQRQRALPSNSEECDENSVFVSSIPLKVRRRDLAAVFEPLEGFEKLNISEPIPKFGMIRFAWIKFRSQDDCLRALELNGTKVEYSKQHPPLYLHVMPKRKSSKSVRSAHFYTLLLKRVEFDLGQVLKVIETINERKMIKDKFDDSILSIFDHQLIKLNLLITYLRVVHNFCYYCGIDYVTEEGLMSRCAKIHPRNSIINIEDERQKRQNNERIESEGNDFKQWIMNLDDKINDFLDKDQSKNILNWVEIKETNFLTKNTILSEKDHAKCEICDKKFSSSDFCQNHILSKHRDKVDIFLKEEEEADFFKAYENDENGFSLESVEAIVPGDVTSFGAKTAITNELESRLNMFRNQRQSFRGRGSIRGRRPSTRGYLDFDKPPGDGEDAIDYGFASETTSIFNL